MAQNLEKEKVTCTSYEPENQLAIKPLLLMNEGNLDVIENKVKGEITTESLILNTLSGDQIELTQCLKDKKIIVQLSTKEVQQENATITYDVQTDDLNFDVTVTDAGVELIALQQPQQHDDADAAEDDDVTLPTSSQTLNVVKAGFPDHSYVLTPVTETINQTNISATIPIKGITEKDSEDNDINNDLNFQPVEQNVTDVINNVEKITTEGNIPKILLATSNFDNKALLSMVNAAKLPLFSQANETKFSTKFPLLFSASTAHEAHEIIKAYAEETLSTFVSMRKMKRFGITEGGIDLQKKKYRVFFESTDVEFDGIPYVYVADKMYICHLGKDKTEVTRQKIRQQSIERRQKLGLPTKDLPTTRVRTKKIDCPVKISVKMIAKFPQFKVHKKSKRVCETASKKVRQALVDTNGNLSCYYVFVGSLPAISLHNHMLGERNSEHEPIDPLIKDKIIQLTWEGIPTSNDVKKCIEEFVENELFAGKTPPVKTRRRYFPNVKDIRNYMNKAKMLSRLSLDLKEELQELALKLQESRPTENIILQSDVSAADNAENKLTPIANKTSLIFCHQTSQQQRIMKRYSNQVYLCEITNLIERVPFPLFCVFVQTNVDYQPVGSFILEVRNKESIMQGLTSLKEWNPGWAPKYFVLDYSEEQAEAVKTVFPASSQFISDSSRERSWNLWLSKVQPKLEEKPNEIFVLFQEIAKSYNETDLHKAALQLENSQKWKDYASIRSWFNSEWLLEAKKWVIGYRPDDFIITMHNDTSLLSNDVKTLLDAHMSFTRGKKLCSLIEKIVDRIIPDFYRRYIDLNRKSFTRANELKILYGDHLPTCLINKPAAVVVHVLDQIKSTQATVYQVSHVQPGVFWVQEASPVTPKDEPAHTVSFGDTTTLPSCDCLEWQQYKLPCRHFCSVFSSFPDWGWDMLNANYIANPLINLDYSCIKPWVDAQDKQVKKMTHFENPTKSIEIKTIKESTLPSLHAVERIETSLVLGDLEIDAPELNSSNGIKSKEGPSKETSHQLKLKTDCENLLQNLIQYSSHESEHLENLKAELRTSIDSFSCSPHEPSSDLSVLLLGKRTSTCEEINLNVTKKPKLNLDSSSSSLDGSYISDDVDDDDDVGVIYQDDGTDIDEETVEVYTDSNRETEGLTSARSDITVSLACKQTPISLLNNLSMSVISPTINTNDTAKLNNDSKMLAILTANSHVEL